MITIKRSETADTRSCDYTQVTKQQLYNSSVQHIEDVKKGLAFFQKQLENAGINHDFDKLSHIDQFHEEFLTGFKQTEWWDNHKHVNRHHLNSEDGIPEFVNLVDVIEYITDCVMAGIARKGEVTFPIEIDKELLYTAFKNTVSWLEQNVELEK